MRLLYFTRDPYPTFRADIAVLFGKYLPRHGILSDIVAQENEPGDAQRASWGGGKALLCGRGGSRAITAVMPILHTLRVLWRTRRTPYDAYQVRDNPLQAAFVLAAAALRRRPFFYWMSFPMVEAYFELAGRGPRSIGWLRYLYALFRGYLGKGLFYRFVAMRATHLFVQSDQMAADMVAAGVPRERMTPVPMGVDLETASPDTVPPADDPRLAGRRIVAYLGTLERTRRVDLLFEALARVRKSIPEVLLVLAGDTPDADHRAWLRSRAEELGVADAVLWTGWLPTAEAWRYLRAAELGVSPFPRGFLLDSCSPTKAVEYMALGLPALVNDQPDQAAVVAESGAGLCAPLTAEGFAEAIAALLADRARLAAMAARGPAYVAGHRSYDIIARRVAGTYDRLLGGAAHA